jgi:hypothetical protein
VKARAWRLRFEPIGAVAPEHVPVAEVWLDVGNRLGPGVVDQHGGDAGATSTTRLALQRHDDLIAPRLVGADDLTLVLHAAPDLDAIGAAWLVARSFERGKLGPTGAVATIVQAIDDHDLGLDAAPDVRRAWPVIARLRLDAEGRDDLSRVRAGFSALDETLESLARGRDLESAALQITTPAVRRMLGEAERDYEADFERGRIFEARLSTPGRESAWRAVDGLHLFEPRSRLFKELARRDVGRSPSLRGFPLLVVSWRVAPGRRPPLWRHVVSTDPRTGLDLRGLGQELEALEQRRENAEGAALLPGRERVGAGQGRHGSNVASPWYDGRGHGHTIVDSPTVIIDGQALCASGLQPEEVVEAIRSLAPAAT